MLGCNPPPNNWMALECVTILVLSFVLFEESKSTFPAYICADIEEKPYLLQDKNLLTTWEVAVTLSPLAVCVINPICKIFLGVSIEHNYTCFRWHGIFICDSKRHVLHNVLQKLSTLYNSLSFPQTCLLGYECVRPKTVEWNQLLHTSPPYWDQSLTLHYDQFEIQAHVMPKK